jgi:pentatricopeptide repeat protein
MRENMVPWFQLVWGLVAIHEPKPLFSEAFERLLHLVGKHADDTFPCSYPSLPSNSAAVGDMSIHDINGGTMIPTVQGSGWRFNYKCENAAHANMEEAVPMLAFIHRLDYNTSGLLLASVGFQVSLKLQWQMNGYAIAREYSVYCFDLGIATRDGTLTLSGNGASGERQALITNTKHTDISGKIQHGQALHLFEHMQLHGVVPDVITYNALMNSCAKGKQLKHAQKVFQAMQRQGVVPNVIAYDTLISACEKGAQPERALELFEAMQRQGVVPNVNLQRLDQCLRKGS